MNANEVIATLAGADVHAERRRQHGPVLERRVPDRGAPRGARGRPTPSSCPRSRRLAGSLEAKARVRRRDQVGPHAPDGRRPGDTRPGVRAATRRRLAKATPDPGDVARLGQVPLGGTAVGTGMNTHAGVRRARPVEADAETGLTSRGRGTGSRRRRHATGSSRVRRAQGRRRLADEDRERPAGDWVGPARGARRDLAARAPEGLLDHARQSQPGHPRGRDPGRGAGDRERHGDHGLRDAGPFRDQRLRADDGQEPARLDRAPLGRVAAFAEKCVAGIEANRERCESYAELTLSAATALNPYIGYDKAARSSSRRPASGRSLREVAREAGVEESVLDKALDYHAMAKTGEGSRPAARAICPARGCRKIVLIGHSGPRFARNLQDGPIAYHGQAALPRVPEGV